MLFEGKVAFVTGSGRGIGRAAALMFAKEGAKVAVLNRTLARAEKTVMTIKESGGEAIAIVGDVAKASDVEQAVAEAVRAFGRLDCAFNNAGVEGQFGPLAELDEETYDLTMATNLKGVWLSMKYELSAMLKNGGGTIVNMSTDITVLGVPGTSIYTASKCGVDGLTRCAAIDYARQGIRINAVGPGSVEDTAMTNRLWSAEQQQHNRDNSPTGRLSTPDDIAEAVLWLCSSRSAHVNGQILNIDGGLALR